MRWIIGTMVGFYILNFWISPIIQQFIFPWGGVPETHLHPIYMGLILLSGLIVACTKIILEEIKGKSNNINIDR
ncbi:MAG TPA: hypothetical protein GX497_02430 [Bacillus bacterium]|nr:hypothetical protein [Bacillus sp. (in: firmicutes)]